MNIPELENALKMGANDAYRLNISALVTYNRFQSKMIESLIQVKIFERLDSWNHDIEDRGYRIFLENNSKTFLEKAFPAYIVRIPENEDNIYAELDVRNRIYRGDHFPKRGTKGRIDIVISTNNENDEEYSKVGIECKAINQYSKKIIADIDRLAHAMAEKDPNVGENQLEICYCVFIERLDTDPEILALGDIDAKKQKCLQKWNEGIGAMPSYQNIITTPELFDIEIGAVENVLAPEGEDAALVAAQTGTVVGVLIKIERENEG